MQTLPPPRVRARGDACQNATVWRTVSIRQKDGCGSATAIARRQWTG